MKTRLAALSLLDRALTEVPDVELAAKIATLPDEHREALSKLAGDTGVTAVREVVRTGRINGGMEQVALIVSDSALEDVIEALGDNAEHPTEEQLAEVLPGMIERNGLSFTRVMMASAVCGEAPASAALVSLLKTNELVKLPPAEPKFVTTAPLSVEDNSPEREALRQARKEKKKAEQAAAAARKAQQLAARHK
jgi:hypothetical protein